MQQRDKRKYWLMAPSQLLIADSFIFEKIGGVPNSNDS
jgi:hypothetical protein